MGRIEISQIFQTPDGTRWAYRSDAPRGGWIGDCLGYSFPSRLGAGKGVYGVLVLQLTWHEGNDWTVEPLMEEIRSTLGHLACERMEAWTDDGGYRHELWYTPYDYFGRAVVRKIETVASMLGWTKIGLGYWPGRDVPSWVAQHW